MSQLKKEDEKEQRKQNLCNKKRSQQTRRTTGFVPEEDILTMCLVRKVTSLNYKNIDFYGFYNVAS